MGCLSSWRRPNPSNLEGHWIVLNKNGSVTIHAKYGGEVDRYQIVVGTTISVSDGAHVKKGEEFAQWDPHNVPILTEKSGKVEFRDMIAGVTVKREVDEATGIMHTVVIDHEEDLLPQIVITEDKTKEILASYPIPAGAHVAVQEGKKVQAGHLLAKTPRGEYKPKDITGGLPRIVELFEARCPQDAAEIAKIDGNVEIRGIVELGGAVRPKRKIIVRDTGSGAEEEHLVPLKKDIIVCQGDFVKKGQQLTEGLLSPHDILDVCGPQELQEHMVNEVQEVYRLQGVEISDKHIEIIVRQMLRKVKITESGDTSLLWNEQVDRVIFEGENERVKSGGGRPAGAVPVLLGITQALFESDSFIRSAAFQDTTRVLSEAAILGRVDCLRGFTENVVLAQLIPAGTGFPAYRNIKIIAGPEGSAKG